MALDDDARPCTVCGKPVLWGTRHPICGQRVMAAEALKERVTPAHVCMNAGTSAGACKTHCGNKERCWGTEP